MPKPSPGPLHPLAHGTAACVIEDAFRPLPVLVLSAESRVGPGLDSRSARDFPTGKSGRSAHPYRPLPTDRSDQSGDYGPVRPTQPQPGPGLGRTVICGTGIDGQALAVALSKQPGTQIVAALAGPTDLHPRSALSCSGGAVAQAEILGAVPDDSGAFGQVIRAAVRLTGRFRRVSTSLGFGARLWPAGNTHSVGLSGSATDFTFGGDCQLQCFGPDGAMPSASVAKAYPYRATSTAPAADIRGGPKAHPSRPHLACVPIASLADAAEVISASRAETVILAMPGLAAPALTEFAASLSGQGIRTLTVPGYAGLLDPAGIAQRLRPFLPSATPSRQASLQRPGRAFASECVMVTGCGGTIGLELCHQLLSRGARRIVLCDQGEYPLDKALRELRLLSVGTGTEIEGVLGSIGDGPWVGRVIRRFGVDSILHAAAYKHVTVGEDQPEAVFRNNTLATATLAERAMAEGVGRFVLVSTDKAVRPSGVMGASKRLAEIVVQDLAARSSGTAFSIVRFGNVIGSSGSVVERFAQQILLGGPVTLTDPEATRYFMTAEDAAGLVLAAGEIAEGGEIFILDMGPPRRIADIARTMIASSGRPSIPILTTGLRPGEKLHEELGTIPGERVADQGPLAHIFCLREPFPPASEVARMLGDLRVAVGAGEVPRILRIAGTWVGQDFGRATPIADRHPPIRLCHRDRIGTRMPSPQTQATGANAAVPGAAAR